MSSSIRSSYVSLGVSSYYSLHGPKYRNPHFLVLYLAFFDAFSVFLSLCADDNNDTQELKLLDLSCGSGEVALLMIRFLKECKEKHFKVKMDVSDPYTLPAFRERMALEAPALLLGPLALNKSSLKLGDVFPLSFLTIPNAYTTTSSKMELVISSFALHIPEKSELFSCLYGLSLNFRWMIILSPHKRPTVNEGMGWIKIKEGVQNRVRWWVYKSCNC